MTLGGAVKQAKKIVCCASLLVLLLGFLKANSLYNAVDDIYTLRIFPHQFLLHEFPGTIICLVLVLLAYVLPIKFSALEKIVSYLSKKYRLIALLTVGLLSVGTLTVYHNWPLTLDEFAPFFQSKIFVAGKLTGQMPPGLLPYCVPDFGLLFFGDTQTGEVISSYWPGFALLLTPFQFLRIPWLLNPLIAGATILLVWKMAKEIFANATAGGWAVLFLLACPVFLVTGMSYYSLNAHLLFNLTYAALLLQPTPRRIFGAGVVGSYALVLHNPYPHFLFALPYVFWLLFQKKGWKNLFILALGYLPLTLLLNGGYILLKKSVLHTAPTLRHVESLGGDGFLQRLSNGAFALPNWKILTVRFMGFIKLCTWTMPGLVFIAALGGWLARKNKPLLLLSCASLTLFFGYFIVSFSQGHGWGYRFYQPALGALPLLATAAVLHIQEASNKEGEQFARFAGALAVCSLLILTPFRFCQVDSFIQRHLSQRPPLDVDQAEVCFIRVREGYYAGDLAQNDPFLRGDKLFVISRGPAWEAEFMSQVFPKATPRNRYEGDPVWLLFPVDTKRAQPARP